ncbi:MAG TPA: class F sortase [Dermatophilaceae bacterium]|nr:class F sortase [Dermatophilaceae bacterium]
MNRLPHRRVVAAAAAALLAGALTVWATEPDTPDPASALASTSSSTAPTPVPPTPPAAPAPPAVPPEGTTSSAAPNASGGPAPDVASRVAVRDAGPSSLAAGTARPAVPSRLAISRIDASLPVSPVGVDAKGVMEIPANPGRAGWYRHSAGVGAQGGATVLAAHVDSRRFGAGPLEDLQSVRPGDEVLVVAGGRTVRYTVERVVRLDKDQMDMGALFDRAGPHRLHVVTCGGAFDRATRHYEDNVVLTAYPKGTR